MSKAQRPEVEGFSMSPTQEPLFIYTADQMEAYAASKVREALNEAALLMDDLYEEAERLAETAEVLEQQRFAGMMHGFDIAQQRIQALKTDQQGEPQ